MNSLDALEELGRSRELFLAFVRSRIADPELAEDIVQASLTRAVEGFESLRDQERAVPWFYSILRNAVTDAYRQSDKVREVGLPPEFDVAEDEPEIERRLCECFAALLPSIKPEYAELIESLDLGDDEPENTARRLGITANNLKVRHHRARQALRRRLDETCRVCAQHHCLDCTCQDEGAEKAPAEQL